MNGHGVSTRKVLLGTLLASVLLVSGMVFLSEDSDADNLIEGELTPTARFWVTDDYKLYIEGTGMVSTYYEQWGDYVERITEIHVSDGITDFYTDYLYAYQSIKNIYVGRDLVGLEIFDPVERVIMENGCRAMEVLRIVFKDAVFFMEEDALSYIGDRHVEISMRLVPNSEIPEEVRDFVGYNRVYEVDITDFGEKIKGEAYARVIYGDTDVPLSVYHLMPTYAVGYDIDYYCTFEVTEAGLYLLHIEVNSAIPNAPWIALAMIIVFTISGWIYYVKVIKEGT